MTFVPHKANQYRPHLIRSYGLVVVLLLIIGVQGTYNFAKTGSVLGVQASITSDQLLNDTNNQRVESKLPTLKLNSQLSQAAYLKANDMFQSQYWAHISPSGVTPWHWFNAAGYNYDYAGENLAKNFTTADAATTAWMASTEHRANILGAHYTDVGFAVVTGVLQGQNTVLIVALFGDPASQGTPAVAGVQTKNLNAAPPQSINIITRVGMAVQSLTPAALGSAFLMIIVAGVALAAHFYRRKLPKALQQSWYRHHGVLKAAGTMSLLLVVVVLYGGGQI